MEDEKHFGLRIAADLLKKFRYVCEYDGRSANGQILYMIRSCEELSHVKSHNKKRDK